MSEPSVESKLQATEVWNEIYPRIKFMSDFKDGTHAHFCIDDIATVLDKAKSKQEAEIAEKDARIKALEAENDRMQDLIDYREAL